MKRMIIIALIVFGMNTLTAQVTPVKNTATKTTQINPNVPSDVRDRFGMYYPNITSVAAERGWESRGRSSNRSGSYRDNQRGGSRSSSSGRGWYGDPQGHSEAA